MTSVANDTPAAPPPPAHHFAGMLCEARHACSNGLWQISVRLQDESGRSLFAHMAPGWGEAGAMACSLQMAELIIGQRYHGSATMRRRGDWHDYFVGHVTLAPDQRRPAPWLRLAASHGMATSPFPPLERA